MFKEVVQPTLLLATDGLPLAYAKQFPTVRVSISFTDEKIFKLNTDGIAAERIQATEEFLFRRRHCFGSMAFWTSWDAFHLYLVAQSLFHYLAHDTKASKNVFRERRLVVTLFGSQCERYSLNRVGLIESTMTEPRTDHALTSNTYTPPYFVFHAGVR